MISQNSRFLSRKGLNSRRYKLAGHFVGFLAQHITCSSREGHVGHMWQASNAKRAVFEQAHANGNKRELSINHHYKIIDEISIRSQPHCQSNLISQVKYTQCWKMYFDWKNAFATANYVDFPRKSRMWSSDPGCSIGRSCLPLFFTRVAVPQFRLLQGVAVFDQSDSA